MSLAFYFKLLNEWKKCLSIKFPNIWKILYFNWKWNNEYLIYHSYKDIIMKQYLNDINKCTNSFLSICNEENSWVNYGYWNFNFIDITKYRPPTSISKKVRRSKPIIFFYLAQVSSYLSIELSQSIHFFARRARAHTRTTHPYIYIYIIYIYIYITLL